MLLALAALSAAASADGASPRAGVCKDKIESLAQCRWIDGTMAIYNGTPSVRIREKGSKNTVAVGPSEDELMPDSLKSKLTPDNEIEGRFRVCPLPRAQPRGMRSVCVDDVRIRKVSGDPGR